jgi:hypothetical protein
MVTADDEQTTDIITEGDVEETTRFCRVRCVHPSHNVCLPLPLSRVRDVILMCIPEHNLFLFRSWGSKKRARST